MERATGSEADSAEERSADSEGRSCGISSSRAVKNGQIQMQVFPDRVPQQGTVLERSEGNPRIRSPNHSGMK